MNGTPEAGHAREAYVSPVFATKEDLQGLPPFTVIAGGIDFLCPDSMTFASHLMEAGVTVTVKKVLGAQPRLSGAAGPKAMRKGTGCFLKPFGPISERFKLNNRRILTW